jgi:NAD(P)-dependent dehydrogenase (short-subunit alcohol dehydrogenase family)
MGSAFSSLDEVRGLAERVLAAEQRLDVLINNAGIGAGGPGAPRQESADGYELRFAVNYLAPFLLTNALLPLLRRSAPARIVNVASAGQVPLDVDDLMLERDYDGWRAYRQSKLAEVMFTFDLAERLHGTGEHGVTVNALHPATFMDTKMAFESVGHATSTIEDGLEPTLRLAIAPELEGMTGRYLDQFRHARAEERAYDPLARRRLWRLSERLTGIRGSTEAAPAPSEIS